MNDAVSMYLGGQYINATDCNYETSKILGLKCPFCNNALFFKSEAIKQTKKGKLIYVKPCFSHYKVGNGDTFDDCERRSFSKAGKDKIKKLKIESRNQRLKLYNKHLWDIVCKDRNIRPWLLNKLPQLLGDNYIPYVMLCRDALALSLDSTYTCIDYAIRAMQDERYAKDLMKKSPNWISKEDWNKEIKEQHSFFTSIDTNLHRAICCEVIEFLSTKSAGHCFGKILNASVAHVIIAEEYNYLDNLGNTISLLAMFIAGVQWVKALGDWIDIENQCVK